MNNSVNPEERYRELRESFEKLSEKHKRILFLLSVARLMVFICGAALSAAGFSKSLFFGFTPLLASALTFIFLLKLYSEHSSRYDHYKNLVKINCDELIALSGDYSSFKDGREWIDQEHDFSNDTDLFGRDSLFQYLNRTVTGFGSRILAGWLSDPFSCTSILNERQAAIRELSAKLNWRQEFAAYGLNRNLEEEDFRGVLEWLNQKPLINSSAFYRVLIYIFPSIALITLAMTITGYIHYAIFTFVFLLNLLITVSFIKETNRIHNLVSKRHNYLASFTNLLLSFDKEKFETSILSSIKSEMTGNSGSAIARIRSLSRIMWSFDSRLNMIVGFTLNGLLLWDLHCINSLERWKRESMNLLPRLLENIGQIDAFNSLANYAYNNHRFAWPLLSDGTPVLSGSGIGHPLLPEGRRICNDFSIDHPGRIIIITGANMAGKSTFLRTVAVNFILGMAGAPVCAGSMTFSAVKLFTSMRTTDSLSHNESYFYAELKRLKILKTKMESGSNVLFILDEILKGTNSADKTSGSRLFIKKCIELGGTGLIATHDTTLAEIEKEHSLTVVNKCFEIEIEGDNVKFDYILRDGITTRMNASILMKEMGIT